MVQSVSSEDDCPSAGICGALGQVLERAVLWGHAGQTLHAKDDQ